MLVAIEAGNLRRLQQFLSSGVNLQAILHSTVSDHVAVTSAQFKQNSKQVDTHSIFTMGKRVQCIIGEKPTVSSNLQKKTRLELSGDNHSSMTDTRRLDPCPPPTRGSVFG